MKKNTVVIYLIVLVFFGCKDERISDLDCISFNMSADIVIDSMKNILPYIKILEDNNCGAIRIKEHGISCVIDGQRIKDAILLEDGEIKSVSDRFSLNRTETDDFVGKLLFLKQNHIDGISRHVSGAYMFYYRQEKQNPNNNYSKLRSLVLVADKNDSIYINKYRSVILDKYNNLYLTAPEDYKNNGKFTQEERNRRRESLLQGFGNFKEKNRDSL